MTNRRSRILQSPKQAEKKRKKLIITVLLICACIILFFIAAILFFRLPFLQISTINVNIATQPDISMIKEKVMSDIEGEYLGLIPRSNIFFYPKSSIKDDLINSFRTIDNLKIKRSGFSSIDIDIISRKTEALLCNGFYGDVEQEERCYSVDKDGYVFERSPDYSDGVYIHYYKDLEQEDAVIGSRFIDIKLFNDFQNFAKVIRNSGIITSGILLGDSEQYELYIKNPDSSDATVYFDNQVSFEKTAENLVVFWNDTIAKQKKATSTTNFDYINLRFGNNIFYVTK